MDTPRQRSMKQFSATSKIQQQQQQQQQQQPVFFSLTNTIFFSLFFSVVYFLLSRWREKIRHSTPLHVVTLSEMAALLTFLASFVYLLAFFGVDLLHSFIPPSPPHKPHQTQTKSQDPLLLWENSKNKKNNTTSPPTTTTVTTTDALLLSPNSDNEELVRAVADGRLQSHTLETRLGDCTRAAAVRREALQRETGKSLAGMPFEGFDYNSILGQCCEMPIGYVQIPVGVAGPLLLDGRVYTVPMATTEGCLVASTNRGCKAIYASGGAFSVVTRDGMTRAPIVRFKTARRASELKFFLEDPLNFETLSIVFNRSSRFARLQSVRSAMAGKNIYLRFCCTTGDAMGMNMVSKGVQNVLDFLQSDFPDMEVVGISGNFCSDKKAAAVNWVEGRGKSVVCEAVIKGEVVKKVLKSSVGGLVELNMLKNLAGSAMAGSIGGFNAHASNIVTAIFIATGQDPAQNVESSQCITMMEEVNCGEDLHVSVTMPSIEVGTVGGGTQLASQSACLNLLGVKGANRETAGGNSRLLATVVGGSVLAGELSLMSALASGQLVNSHLKYNRSCNNMTQV